VRAETVVSQAMPVMMLARCNRPPQPPSRDDWLKPAPASAVVTGMVTAVAAQ
jgi:hypothetical protein